ncbi:MAG: GNAT family N-acetyltransferase [Patescibacteria group bacterium]|nr:GNAT family N-acetyltransferase [Patescibacteria group bacterium]
MNKYQKPTTNDLPDALKVINAAREPYKKLPIYKEMKSKDTTLNDLLENEQNRDYRVFRKDKEIIGFLAFKFREKKLAWLSQFYIKPELQGQGYGRKFMKEFEKEIMNSSKAKYIVLEYWPDATWAKNFYIKLGYSENEQVYKSKSNYTKVLVKEVG